MRNKTEAIAVNPTRHGRAQIDAVLRARQHQYASKNLRRRLARHGMRQSMSRKGDCWDYAVAESFFATIKKELVRGYDFHSHSAAQHAIFEYIEAYYNRTRKHSYLNGVSPERFQSCNQQAIAA